MMVLVNFIKVIVEVGVIVWNATSYLKDILGENKECDYVSDMDQPRKYDWIIFSLTNAYFVVRRKLNGKMKLIPLITPDLFHPDS